MLILSTWAESWHLGRDGLQNGAQMWGLRGPSPWPGLCQAATRACFRAWPCPPAPTGGWKGCQLVKPWLLTASLATEAELALEALRHPAPSRKPRPYPVVDRVSPPGIVLPGRGPGLRACNLLTPLPTQSACPPSMLPVPIHWPSRVVKVGAGRQSKSHPDPPGATNRTVQGGGISAPSTRRQQPAPPQAQGHTSPQEPPGHAGIAFLLSLGWRLPWTTSQQTSE